MKFYLSLSLLSIQYSSVGNAGQQNIADGKRAKTMLAAATTTRVSNIAAYATDEVNEAYTKCTERQRGI